MSYTVPSLSLTITFASESSSLHTTTSRCTRIQPSTRSFCFVVKAKVASLMPGMDLSVTTRLSPCPRDMSPALAIALPMMKSVNIMPMPAQCFENLAYHTDRTEDVKSSKSTSRQESADEDHDTIRANNYKNDTYFEKNIVEERTDARTPLLKDHKIESLDETKLRENKIEKRKSSAST
ncbi:hypothetical protein JYU34_001397 [Plutella xylostella]|uniref:Uncharacterized protein n=1 Tax=Plutella xylostella TaxID=51655 RepID=A0ABQ7R3X7_PLUXY|nr:hypothetical protein JYU34_001397 [Plutella xylostella]